MEDRILSDDVVPLANLTGIQFGLLTRDEITTLSVMPSISKPKDVIDSCLGIPNQSLDQKCSSCGASDAKLCEGHFGCILLRRVIYNPHLIADTVAILNKICPCCLSMKNNKRELNILKHLAFLKEDCKKGGKMREANDSENVGTTEPNLQIQRTVTDIEHVPEGDKINGISGDSAYMVSSDDEEDMEASEDEDYQNYHGFNKKRPKNVRKGLNANSSKEFKMIGKATRVMPPRKSKIPIHYAEKSLMKNAADKHGPAQKEANKIAVSRCNSYGSVETPLENINNSTISSEEAEELGVPHFDTAKKLLGRELSVSKHGAHDQNSAKLLNDRNADTGRSGRKKCRYCQSDMANADKLYPPVRFKAAAKNIRGKVFPTIIMEIEPNRGRKVDEVYWSNYIANDYWGFIPGGQESFSGTVRTTRALLPFQAREIIRRIQDKRITACPEALFLECVAVTPIFHRIKEKYHTISNGLRLTFDERTRSLQKLVQSINAVKGALLEWTTLNDAENLTCTLGGLVSDYFQASKLVRAKSSGVKSKGEVTTGMKWVKSTLLGKRSDHSFRMIAIGDPNIAVDEILISREVAEKLIIRETVNFINWGKLKEYIESNLTKSWMPLIRRNGSLLPISHSTQIEIGDTVYRALKDGDLVIVNRTPSIHLHSLIALRVKLLKIKSAMAINPVICSPFGADFDGDCLHGFIPQSVKSMAEADEFMTLSKQMINSQGGQALIAVTHDSLLAGNLITSNHIFLDKFQIQQLQLFCSSPVPMPAIVKAPMLRSPLWTGKQLFSMVLPTGLNYTNLRKEVLISDGELLCCSGGSEWLQNTSDSIFQVISIDRPSSAVEYLSCCQAVLNEWISMKGFSVSLSDVHLTSSSSHRRKMIEEISFGLLEAKQSVHSVQIIYGSHSCPTFVLGQYECRSEYLKLAGMIESESLALSKEAIQQFRNVYSDIIKVVAEHIEQDNAMLMMIKAGSKGSLQKLVQQGACLGMQMYKEEERFPFKVPEKICSSQWVPTCLTAKSKDHISRFLRASESIQKWYSRGLIENSFFDGLNPIEYFIHAVSTRGNSFGEGADIPGQLFRNLMFFLRDVFVAYDGTIRSVYGKQIMQFSYGGIQQKDLEGRDWFERASGKTAGEPVGALAASSLSEVAYSILEKQFQAGNKHPLNILKESLCCWPKHNIKMKEHDNQRHNNQRVILRLSNKLKSIHCGQEYGASKVKEHLETVRLCQLSISTKIIYEKLEKGSIESMKIPMSALSPWAAHFLLCKERLKENKLTVQSVILALNKEYKSLRKKCSSLNLPELFIDCRNPCHLCVPDKAHNDTLCLVFLTEISSDTHLEDVIEYSEAVTSSLDVIRDFLIPKLLDVVVKGHPNIDSLTIEWEENSWACEVMKNSEKGELVVTVVSKGIQAGGLWKTLLNACEAITDLIDWQRSGPESIYEVWHSMGIEAARNCCLHRLEGVARVMDKPIHKSHLHLIVDCLSVTGVFYGLTPIGLGKHLNQCSVSAPFMQACFMKPKKHFLEAAKKGTLDNLSGPLDSLVWGKVAPIGTGTSFDIILNEKKQEPIKSVDVCEFLNVIRDREVLACPTHPVESFKDADMTGNVQFGDQTSSAFTHIEMQKFQTKAYCFPPSNKLGKIVNSHVPSMNSRETKGSCQVENCVEEIAEPDFPPGFEPYNIGDAQAQGDFVASEEEPDKSQFPEHGPSRVKTRSKFLKARKQWKSILILFHSLRGILHNRYKMGDILHKEDKSIVMHALLYHPRSKEKTGVGIAEIKIGFNPEFPQSRCFVVVRKDGSIEDFSYHKCLSGLAGHFSPDLAFEYQQRLCPHIRF